jgi:ATP-dependent 26S proteasome regulatory subunit
MEMYHGLAILAMNMKNSFDIAFMRRIRFSLNFPFPDEKNRVEIWRHVFPPNSPKDHLDIRNLEKLNITGENIHNIALYASFLAAEKGMAVNMDHLKRAAQVEYAKLERPLS